MLRVQGRDASVLLTGDIERPQEAALVAADAGALRSDLLIVPHHGSRSSSSSAFLDAVQPRVAVIQAGYRNRFGHPAPDVVLRLRERGVQIIDSPRCGAWTWAPHASTGEASGVCQRDVVRHYWQHRIAAPASAGGTE